MSETQIDIPKPLKQAKVVMLGGPNKGKIRDPLVAQEEANTILESVGYADPHHYKLKQDAIKALQERTDDYILTSQAAKTEKAENTALIDPLTGLLNRRGITLEITREIREAERKGKVIQVVFTDVRDFKKINDTHGHRAGDYALSLIAQGFKGNIRGYDEAGRFGGDEDVLLLPDGDPHIADFLRTRLHQFLARENLPYNNIDVDMGVAEYNPKRDGHLTAEELMVRADQAMYFAKRNKLDHVARWDASMAGIVIPEDN